MRGDNRKHGATCSKKCNRCSQKNLLSKIEVRESEPDGGVVEVIVTKVKAGKEGAYREWETKIQQAQSKFPGYCGSYVQPPLAGELGWDNIDAFRHRRASRHMAEIS
jgi:hypothetical protein